MKRLYFTLCFFFALISTSLLSAQTSCLVLQTTHQVAQTGETVCFDITAKNFNEIIGLQYSMQWDTTVLSFKEVTDFNLVDLTAANFGLPAQTQLDNQINFAWSPNNSQAVSLTDDVVIYSVCFDVIGAAGTSSPFLIGSLTTNAEFLSSPNNLEINLEAASLLSGSLTVGETLPDFPIISSTSCPQANGCSEVPPLGIQTETSGGAPPFSYSWTNALGLTENTPSITDVQSGTYQMEVTDAEGLTSSAIFVVPPAPPGVQIDVEHTTISNPTACDASGIIDLSVIGGSGEYEYQWDNGVTTEDIAGLNSGTYSVTVTDLLTACSDFGTFTIGSTGVEFDGTIGYDDCSNNTGFITLEVSGNPVDYTYSWTTGATTKDITDLAFGAYRVTVTDINTGCTGIRTFNVYDSELLLGYSWECTFIDDQTIFAEITTIVWRGGTPPYTFDWSNGESSTDDFIGSTTVSLPATLTVTITDAKGCSTISDPITPDCDGGGASTDFSTASSYNCVNAGSNLAEINYRVWEGGIPPYTFTWSTGESQMHSSESNIIASADAGAQYTVTVTDQTGRTHVSNPISPVCNISGDPLTLDLGDASVAPGSSACIPVTVQDFDNIISLQFSLSWDPSKLIGDSITNIGLPNLGTSNYSFSPIAQYPSAGVLTFAWIDPLVQGESLPDDSPLFEICFTAIGSPGEVDVVFSNHPTLIEAANGLDEIIPVTIWPGSVSIDNASNDGVWPGDTDHNGIVDHFDLLNIGLAHNTDGFPRPDANLMWETQFAADWTQETPNTLTNYKHIDTDGNSIINDSDTLALARNYSLFNDQWNGEDGYTDRASLPISARTTGTPIYVNTFAVAEGTSPVFDIMLGDEENTQNTVYGLGFTIDYDPLAIVPGSIKLSFEDSWIGQAGENLLTFYRVDSQNHKVHVALTRTDGIDITGEGPIAQLLITIEDVIFRSTNYEIPISIENARLISAQEEAIPVQERSSIISVGNTTNTIDPSIDSQIKVYPIPAKDILFLKTPNLNIKTIELYSLEGRRLKQWQNTQDPLSIKEIANGTYALRLITDQGVAVRKVVILNR